MTNVISAFPPVTIEGVSKIFGVLYSGTELTRTMAEVPVRSDPGEGHTKWRRLDSAFRNPVAHEPKLHWTMSELDALDVLGTLSKIHRRLDATISWNGEGV